MDAPPPLEFSERETQILTTAEELLLKWGYKRVTMDEVARHANVGKGTLYLHWKSREALFQTLLLREALTIWRLLMAKVVENPDEIRYSRLLRNTLLVVMERPLAKVLFTGNSEILGKLAGNNASPAMRTGQMMAYEQFVTQYRAYGLLRTDQSQAEQLYLFQAALMGFFMLDPALFIEDGLILEARADLLAYTVAQLFEPTPLPAPDAVAQIAAEMRLWMEGILRQYEQIIQGLMT